MSLLLTSLFSKPVKQSVTKTALDQPDLSSEKRRSAWLLSYIALFTSLLAFFILTISLLELETSVPKRSHQKLVTDLSKQVLYLRNKAAIPWLKVDSSVTRGVRLTLSSDLVGNEPLFKSAKAQINPRYLPYLRSVVAVLNEVDIKNLPNQYRSLVKGIETEGFQLKFILKVEGHTDANPMAENARFKNNVELSTYRAYAMMDWMRIQLGLPKDQFAIAGYGSFRPLTSNPEDAENRRIEIYLMPQLVAIPKPQADDTLEAL